MVSAFNATFTSIRKKQEGGYFLKLSVSRSVEWALDCPLTVVQVCGANSIPVSYPIWMKLVQDLMFNSLEIDIKAAVMVFWVTFNGKVLVLHFVLVIFGLLDFLCFLVSLSIFKSRANSEKKLLHKFVCVSGLYWEYCSEIMARNEGSSQIAAITAVWWMV